MSEDRFTVLAVSHFTTLDGTERAPGDVLITTNNADLADKFRDSPTIYAVFDSRETGKHAELSVTATSTPTCTFGECDHKHVGADTVVASERALIDRLTRRAWRKSEHGAASLGAVVAVALILSALLALLPAWGVS